MTIIDAGSGWRAHIGEGPNDGWDKSTPEGLWEVWEYGARYRLTGPGLPKAIMFNLADAARAYVDAATKADSPRTTTTPSSIEAAGGLEQVAELLTAARAHASTPRLSAWASAYGLKLLELARRGQMVDGSRWRHFKGGTYTRLGIADHTEVDGEQFVIYQGDMGDTFARPIGMWNEVPPCGDGSARFTKLED